MPQAMTSMIARAEHLTEVELECLLRDRAVCLNQTIQEMAAIVEILASREVDIDPLRKSFPVDLLLKIACGGAVAEVILRFVEIPYLLKHVLRLGYEEQLKLAAGEHVPLVQLDEKGQYTLDMRDPLSLVDSQIQQVFDTSIRNQQEQIRWLEQRHRKA
jgi:hypothetical protein